VSGPILKGFRPNRFPKPGGGIIGPGGQPARPDIICDAIGRPLQAGDRIQVEVGHPHLFEVVSISPIVDPNAPADVVDNNLVIIVRATLKFVSGKGEAAQEFLRIAQAAEFQQSQTTQPPKDEPQDPPSETGEADPAGEQVGDPPSVEGEEVER
jgi:hypothetical protein